MYVSTHYRPYGIKETAFTTSHIQPFTAVYSVENLTDVYISILGTLFASASRATVNVAELHAFVLR